MSLVETYPPGWMAPDCIRWLREQAEKVEAVAIEVGSFKGRSATAIVEGLRDGAMLYCVDNWKGVADDPDQQRGFHGPGPSVYEQFVQNMSAEIETNRVVPMAMDSLEGARLLHEQHGTGFADFCFIDADHRYEPVLADIKAYLPLVRAGGVLAGHDYSTKRWVGVKQAVDRVFGRRAQRGPGSIWFVEVSK